MRDNMYEGLWSPFDPLWYQQAFDKFISTADQLFNQDEIIKMGFNLPDSDGSKSSVFHSDAVLNNSFNEKALRETLKDIYINSSHKLKASNHDNVHFFKWHGTMNDVEIIANTNKCQIVLPTESFIFPNERDIFKLSQFYRKWISITDIMNNWRVFKWTCLLFVNKRIYSDYEIRIDDHETTIRFRYEDFWTREDRNYPIYIYKFDTNFQRKVKISRELVNNQWKYMMPLSYISDDKSLNLDKVVVAFNKISDSDIRTDGNIAVDVMGDNIEFLSVKDGYVDMSTISDYNRALIDSELTEYLWMSIFVPKFFHEYPILLPVDVIYREYQPRLVPVVTNYSQRIQKVKSHINEDNIKQVYIDLNGGINRDKDGWKSMIRPIVLSDAFDDMANDPYDTLEEELGPLRELTIKGADIIEEFRFFIKDYTTDERYYEYCDKLENIMERIKNVHDTFLSNHRMPLDNDYNEIYKKFVNEVMPTIRTEGYRSIWFRSKEGSLTDFWHFISPMIYIPRELADHYSLSNIINHMSENKILWENIESYRNKLRFTRPIDELDFFFMEYDQDKRVWRPCDLKIEHHFPDVYLLSDENEEELSKRIFKAFFFYSDTINVRKESVEINRATPSWTDDMETYELNKEGIYRNIFMEKFYWMGIRSIYRGMFNTNSRWESIEYVYDNDSYQRFNQLFLNTMDLYFKMGLATYLKSANYEFPFDDAIDKMNEGINSKFLGYKKITNYEMYLDKTWVPSYFDYVLHILDDWTWDDRLIKRPRNTFNIERLVPILVDIQNDITDKTNKFNLSLDWIIEKLELEDYNLNKPVRNYNVNLLQQYLNVHFNNLVSEDVKDKKDEIIALLEEYGLLTGLISFHVDKDDHLVITYSKNGIKDLRELSDELVINIVDLNEFTKDLDLEIYSIEDVNEIIKALLNHNDLMERIKRLMSMVYNDAMMKMCYPEKMKLHEELSYLVNTLLERHIDKISAMIQSFDMPGFMRATNDLRSYNDYDKKNPDDMSLLGYINSFGSNSWPDEVKEIRNRLFTSTVVLYGNFIPSKSYDEKEVAEFVKQVNTVKKDVLDLREVISKYWQAGGKEDQTLIDRLDHTEYLIEQLYVSVDNYMAARNDILNDFDKIRKILAETKEYNISDTEISYSYAIESSLAGILEALSYIAGTNNKDSAMESLRGANKGCNDWLSYLYMEKTVFDRIIEVTKLPNDFLNLMDKYNKYSELLDAVIEYMNTVNEPFTPDPSLPTYSDIYQIDEIEMVSGGFMNKLGEVVFVPGLGSYRITEVDENIGKVTAIAELGYRNTTFRDPCIQKSVYDSVTNGTGLGITFHATKSSHTKVINDEIVSRFIIRINGSIYRIKRNLSIINPYNNREMKLIIDDIREIKKEWNDLLSFYLEYMSDIKDDVSDVIESLYFIIEDLEEFIETRMDIDVGKLLNSIENLTIESYKYFRENNLLTGNYFYYDDQVRISYNNLCTFYSNGSNWTNAEELVDLLKDVESKIKSFYRNILRRSKSEELINRYENIISIIDNTINTVNTLPDEGESICLSVKDIEDKMLQLPAEMYKDTWFRIRNTTVAENGKGYKVGDVFEIIPELPHDQFGNPIKDDEDIIFNDTILYQVAQVSEDGGVLKVNPLMNYALPYSIHGTREMSTRVGEGTGCILNIATEETSMKNSSMFFDETSDEILPPQFNENDLFMFKFENIHDLDLGYEVFYDGKQIRDFVIRHVTSDDPLHPSNIDIIYLKANDVMELKNSSIFKDGEHYFIYKLDKADVVEPGAGYAVGQSIYVDTGNAVVKVRIDKLDDTPFKGIAKIDLSSSNALFKSTNPSSSYARVATDSLNNIDDEYNVGYYDQIPPDGIEKPSTLSYDGEIYNFTSRRFDDLEDGDRNKTFMYTDVEMPEGGAETGDPDSHWYLGSRVDNSQVPMKDKHRWNGVMNLIPPTHPFIPDDRRLPTKLPVTGEYQRISQLRLHDSSDDVTSREISPISASSIEEIIKFIDDDIKLRENPPLIIEGKTLERIPDENVSGIVSGNKEAVPSGIMETSEAIIEPIEAGNVSDIMNGLLLPTAAPTGLFYDNEIISNDVTAIFDFTLRNTAMEKPDLTVATYNDIPKHINDWLEAKIGKTVVVECDETNNGHRMMYRLRSFVAAGYFVFDTPEIADMKWASFDVDWMNCDFYPDIPTNHAQYPEAPWRTSKTFIAIQRSINDKRVLHDVEPKMNHTTYIHDLKLKDLSVFNFTTKKWEDLYDYDRWKLDIYEDEENKHWGFKLTLMEEGAFTYDMILYLNKVPETQVRNAALKKNAVLDIESSLYKEINTKPLNISINTGRHLRIRKLFPYEQRETFVIGHDDDGTSLGYEMNFKIANYMHFKNEIHLEDVKIYNRNAGRFENLLDTRLFEVRFKSDEYVQRGFETQTKIIKSLISNAGDGFVDGNVWCWNAEYGIHVFAQVTTNPINGGSLSSFIPLHCPNPPKEDISLEFLVYQNESQSARQVGKVMMEFHTERVEVFGDGYIHNVTNRFAPLPKEFKIICKYNLTTRGTYDVIISKSPKQWTFVEPRWIMSPTFTLKDVNIQADRLYAVTDRGRFPIINPSTNKPTLNVVENETGTDVTFLNLYKKYEHFEVHAVPYPMKSVYVQRRISSSGFIDLKGKLNKPLSKKYFEFWLNGRLLDDEVTIITPTKLFLHGLKSLRNFEIVEINRDPNEYFSDNFLGVEQSGNKNRANWDFNTYLDDALEGTLKGDNYTEEEQEYLLTPVWKQVERDHPEYKNYPPNVDVEEDILQRVEEEDYPLEELEMPVYQYIIIDTPTLEGKPIADRNMTFEHFGFTPLTNSDIVNLLNEEWSDEISKGKVPTHTIISDDVWYGMATRLYDEFGIRVHNLDEAAYNVTDVNLLKIDSDNRLSRIVRNPVVYDLD